MCIRDSPYYSLNAWLKDQFGQKIYKLALDGGMTCPNRDGTLGTGGCIFCSHGGSGDFAEPAHTSVTEQIEAAKARVANKIKGGKYVAYFQSYTNTYAPVSYLEPLFSEAIAHPDVAALSIGTRPDCLPPDVLELLARLNRRKPVWVELGLQTIHEESAARIQRGYSLPVFENAVRELKAAGLTVIVHVDVYKRQVQERHIHIIPCKPRLLGKNRDSALFLQFICCLLYTSIYLYRCCIIPLVCFRFI